jgi:tetratricopeptide (TPR) repeat protein
MNFAKNVYSYFLMCVASRHQGKGHFDRAIKLSLKAKRLNPRSTLAFLILGDDYRRIKEFENAKLILKEALEYYPNDLQFNQLMVMAIFENNEPIENSIPFIKTYITNHKKNENFNFKSSVIFRIMSMFLSHKKLNLEGYFKGIVTYNEEWAIWAKLTLENHEKKHIQRNGTGL